MIENEKEKRKKFEEFLKFNGFYVFFNRFLSSFGKILPSEFIPQLKSMPPNLTVSNLSDADLPKIDGFHSESDSYLNKSP